MFTTRPEIIGTFGVAASTHWLATQTAMSVLERGGNAFDAAVAGGFVLQIVEPHLSGPGGEVPVLFWDERSRRSLSIHGQGWAPAGASPNTFKSMGLHQVPGMGLLAATVPGAFGAWMTLLARHGTWSLAQVLEPAITFADEGFPVASRLSQAILAVRELFLTEWTTSADVWLSGGRVPRPGTLHRLPVLAATYKRLINAAEQGLTSRVDIIENAIEIWQQGFVAIEIDRFCRESSVADSSGERHGGLLRYDDMAQWRPAVESPLATRFGDYEVQKCGFGTQGPLMLQSLQLLKFAGLQNCDPLGADFVHRVSEALKLGLADRLAWYGLCPVPQLREAQSALLTEAYARARWSARRCASASAVLEPGHPLGRSPVLPDLSVSERTLKSADARYGVGEPTFAALPPPAEWDREEIFVGDTCHIDVIDSKGNMVSATPSGGWLSSSPCIPSLGFPLGTRLQATWLDEGLPNSLVPRVAPCMTLTPSLVMKQDEPYMVFGTPGGDQQDQWSTVFFLRHVLFGMNLQEAIDCPAWHVNHSPSSFWPRTTQLNMLTLESRFPAQTVDQLRAFGHEMQLGDPWSEGRLSACSRHRTGSGKFVFKAAANPRGAQGYAVGR